MRSEKVIKALVLLALAAAVLVLGFKSDPKATAAVTAVSVGVTAAFWWWFCRKQGVPLFLWEEREVGKDEESSRPIMMTVIVILGLVEIRNIPQKFAWVVRNPFSRNDDPSNCRSYKDLRQGWQKIILPKLLWMEVEVVDLRTQGLDAGRVRTNTRRNPVDVDTTLMFKVIDPIVYAVIRKGKLKDLILQALSVAINYVTTGYTDVELVEIAHAGELMKLADNATDIINGGVDNEVPDVGRFGIEVVVGFQNVFPLEGVLKAMAGVTEADLGAQAAVKRGDALKSLRIGAGMPEQSPFNILLPVAEGFQKTFAEGKGGLRFPTVTLDLGGVDSSGTKAGKEGTKNNEETGETEETPPAKPEGRQKKRGAK